MKLSDEHYLAIGRICVAFSELDQYVSYYIWTFISTDRVASDQPIGQIITSEISFTKELDLLCALFKYRIKDKNQVKILEKFISRISEIEQNRNTMLHSIWISDKTDDTKATRFKITAKRKKGLHWSIQTIIPDELNDIADDFDRVKIDFRKFMMPIERSLRGPN